MDYDLSRLSSRSFEQLIQVLASKVLGPGLVPFGDGPDGGRDATIRGRVPYPSTGGEWDGYIVLQAKFRQRPQSTTADARWAYEQLSQELHRYRTRDHLSIGRPDYLIFATNVTLSAGAGGGKDKLFRMAEDMPPGDSKLRGFDVWDYDKLRTYLDQYEDVRRSFGAFVLPGDVLAEMAATIEKINEADPKFDESVARFLQKELLAEQWANLDQAGTASEDQVPVSRVFVDLPVFDERRADPPAESASQLIPGLVSEVVELAGLRLDPRTSSASEGPRRRGPDPGKIVLIGGPGQGKSTIGQFLCQLFRAALLRSRPAHSLAPEVTPVLEMIEDHCRRNRLDLPSARRFPLRVVLTEFADDLASPEGVDSLLEYLAQRISKRIPGEVGAPLMSTWLAEYPWLLVLDGLDEVPPSSNREEVIAAVREFWIEVAESNADCLVIATTRPQGYANEFSPSHYRHLWLAPISPARALHYADRLLDVRFGADSERRQRIAQRLERATESKDTARLMTSPLQVTIMTALLDRMGKPPPSRWSLFSQYYRVIYEREVERDIPAAQILRDYKTDIDAIHQNVGLLLQVDSEQTEQAEARMPREQFAEIVIARLSEEGHDAEADPKLVEAIIEAAMNRLVLLVGLRADEVGFELRSLQEFMAAEALLDGREADFEERLRVIAPLPSWRNVFLFAAGRCFFDLAHLRDTIHTICVELDDPANEQLAPIAMPGAALAVDLIADGIAYTQPRYQRLLGREALRLVRRPPSAVDNQLAEIYTPALRTTYEEELRAVLATQPFVATLGAWRTLAVMHARGTEWARGLLQEHFPSSEHLSDLLFALPQSARSTWLSAELALRCVAAPPEQTLSRADHLKALNVLTFTPRWYLELAGVGLGDRTINVFPWPKAGLDLGLVSVKARKTLPGALDPEAQAHAPATWCAHLAALRFAADPSAAALTNTLEELLRFDNYTAIREAADIAPWPLASLMCAAEDRATLEFLTARAREGAFGDLPAWQAAEERWRRGIDGDDLDLELDERLPYDATIDRRGFPLAVASAQGLKESKAKARNRALFEVLSRSRHPPARQRALGLLLGSLAEPSIQQRTRRADLDARRLAFALAPQDLAGLETLDLGSFDSLHWSLPLDQAQMKLLDEIGRQIGHTISARGAMPPWFSMMLADAWVRYPDRTGLCRILASYPTESAAGNEWGWRLLAVPPTAQAGAPHALLQLRLMHHQRWEEIPLEAIAREGYFLGPFIDQLADSGVDEPTQKILLRLDGLIPREEWHLRRSLDNLASVLLGRRPSHLAIESTWRSLGLFELPWQGREGRATARLRPSGTHVGDSRPLRQ